MRNTMRKSYARPSQLAPVTFFILLLSGTYREANVAPSHGVPFMRAHQPVATHGQACESDMANVA